MAAPIAVSRKKGTIGIGGFSDSGSNRIAALIEDVPVQVENLLDKIRTDATKRTKRTIVLIRAHSRGAVAASQVARDLKQRLPWIEVELVLFDPVPGPAHAGSNLQLDLGGANLSELTLVYSVASGYRTGFDPQLVFGAKRIIISTQQHSAGKAAGFTYKNKVYRGSNLNSLDPGVYVDFNQKDKNDVELVKVDDMRNALKQFKRAQKRRVAEHGGGGDRDRRILEVLNDYFRKASNESEEEREEESSS